MKCVSSFKFIFEKCYPSDSCVWFLENQPGNAGLQKASSRPQSGYVASFAHYPVDHLRQRRLWLNLSEHPMQMPRPFSHSDTYVSSHPVLVRFRTLSHDGVFLGVGVSFSWKLCRPFFFVVRRNSSPLLARVFLPRNTSAYKGRSPQQVFQVTACTVFVLQSNPPMRSPSRFL